MGGVPVSQLGLITGHFQGVKDGTRVLGEGGNRFLPSLYPDYGKVNATRKLGVVTKSVSGHNEVRNTRLRQVVVDIIGDVPVFGGSTVRIKRGIAG